MCVDRLISVYLVVLFGSVSFFWSESVSARNCAKLVMVLSKRALPGQDGQILLQMQGRALDPDPTNPIRFGQPERDALRETSQAILARPFIFSTTYGIPTGLVWLGLSPRARTKTFEDVLESLEVGERFDETYRIPEADLVAHFEAFKKSHENELNEIRTRVYAGKNPTWSQRRLLRSGVRQIARRYGALPGNAPGVMARELGLPKESLDFLSGTSEGVMGVAQRWGKRAAMVVTAATMGYGGLHLGAQQGVVPRDVTESIDRAVGRVVETASETAGDLMPSGGAPRTTRVEFGRDR
jgi:hypothetical protein